MEDLNDGYIYNVYSYLTLKVSFLYPLYFFFFNVQKYFAADKLEGSLQTKDMKGKQSDETLKRIDYPEQSMYNSCLYLTYSGALPCHLSSSNQTQYLFLIH